EEETEWESKRLWRELEGHTSPRAGLSDCDIVVRTDLQTRPRHLERPAVTKVAYLRAFQTVIFPRDRDWQAAHRHSEICDGEGQPAWFVFTCDCDHYLTRLFLPVRVSRGYSDDVVAVCDCGCIESCERCS